MRSVFKGLLKKTNIPRLVNLIVICSVLSIMFNLKLWKRNDSVISWDVISYYAYLPATFIHNDITLEFMKEAPEKYYYKFWPSTSPTGKKVIKTSMGLSILYSPFFFAGHGYAHLADYEPDGFSSPYRFALQISSVFYLFLGLFFLRRILLRYFTPLVTSMTLFLVVIATNLFWYVAIRSCISHAYSFACIIFFIYRFIKWDEKPNIKNTIILGLIAGLVALIRPTNILILLFIPLWNVGSWKEFTSRIVHLVRSSHLILIMAVAFLLVWIPQLLYWKAQTGSLFYFSYGSEEKFYLLNPQIIRALFGYRNGWLLYTPIMIFAIIGLVRMRKKFKEFFLPSALFMIILTYLLVSWWCWWHNGYGNRAFIDTYGLMSIPLAFFISRTLEKKLLTKIIVFACIIFMVSLNIFQMRQHKKGILSSDSMTKEAYWAVFGSLTFPDNHQFLLQSPDYEKSKKGIYTTNQNHVNEFKFDEIYCDAEQKVVINERVQKFMPNNLTENFGLFHAEGQTDSIARSGKHSIGLNEKNQYGMEFIIKQAHTNDTYEASIWKYGEEGIGSIVVEGKIRKALYIAERFPDSTDTRGWERLSIKFKVPSNLNGNTIKIYAMNANPQFVYFDDLVIKCINE